MAKFSNINVYVYADFKQNEWFAFAARQQWAIKQKIKELGKNDGRGEEVSRDDLRITKERKSKSYWNNIILLKMYDVPLWYNFSFCM